MRTYTEATYHPRNPTYGAQTLVFRTVFGFLHFSIMKLLIIITRNTILAVPLVLRSILCIFDIVDIVPIFL